MPPLTKPAILDNKALVAFINPSAQQIIGGTFPVALALCADCCDAGGRRDMLQQEVVHLLQMTFGLWNGMPRAIVFQHLCRRPYRIQRLLHQFSLGGIEALRIFVLVSEEVV